MAVGRLTVLGAGGLLGLLWWCLLVTVFVGPSKFNPTHLGWLMHGDGAQHVLGWLFFRHASWTFPLGSVPNFGYPVGTTVGFTDAIPWVAVVAKSLSPLLPVDFQYFGLWQGFCVFLQGVLGVRIVQELSPSPFIQLLGGLFFIVDPLLLRDSTPGAHWLILGMTWLHIRRCPDRLTPYRILWVVLGFCLVSAGIHPYLAVMVLALSLALLCKLCWIDRLLSTRQLLSWGVACGASVVAVLALFGYIGTKTSLGAGGFGHFSADVLTLINPMGLSRFLPALPTGPGQIVGFGYVGAGVLVLSLLGMALSWRNLGMIRGCLRPWGWLGACCLLLAAFALSSTVTIAGKPVLDLSILYQPLMAIVAPFRASGRFIWPLHYLVIAGALALWISHYQSSKCIQTVILTAAVLIQVMDINIPWLWWWDSEKPQRAQQNVLQMDGWQHAAGLYEHMVLYPPQLYSNELICTI
jgi:Family of unknown function (DUF6311)